MIVGLEWLIILLLAGFIILWAASAVSHYGYKKYTLSIILAILATVCGLTCVGINFGLLSAQKNVESHYIEYCQLQTYVAKYDELDMLEQFKVNDDVMTYNLWYERNKSDLENEWSWKGTSDYAKEFDYIIIGG